MIDKARGFAQERLPSDKFEHSLRVMAYAIDLVKNYDITCATYVYVIALLHDVVEDTDTTVEEIEKEFGKYVGNCVRILTHNKGIETYPEYIDRIMSSNFAEAKLVKHADMKDHLAQKETLTPRLKEKYFEVIDRFI